MDVPEMTNLVSKPSARKVLTNNTNTNTVTTPRRHAVVRRKKSTEEVIGVDLYEPYRGEREFWVWLFTEIWGVRAATVLERFSRSVTVAALMPLLTRRILIFTTGKTGTDRPILRVYRGTGRRASGFRRGRPGRGSGREAACAGQRSCCPTAVKA